MSRYCTTLAFGLLTALLLAGCATAFDIGGADTALTPQQAAAAIDTARHKKVAWGGMIVDARNLTDRTQLELLGYPLDDHNRPDRDAKPIGRFLAVHPGYLETADFKDGRLVTVVGIVAESRTGTVGEARYVYPVVNVTSLKLWPTEQQDSTEPRFHFGVGVGITR